jgi:hypothetical protein
MKCPKCGSNISDKLIAKYLASKGGSKSRRVLTPEQARKMVEAREAKRKTKGKDNER